MAERDTLRADVEKQRLAAAELRGRLETTVPREKLLAADSRAEGAAAEAKTAALDAARRAAELAEVVPALKEAQAEPPPFPVLTGQVSSLPQY